MEQKPITTKQLISKLLELDPDGNKQVCSETPLDQDFGGWLYEDSIEIDGNNGINLYVKGAKLVKTELEEELEEELAKIPVMTTQELISTLREHDPDGNKKVYFESENRYYRNWWGNNDIYGNPKDIIILCI